jgi:hypothetical protein
MSRKTLCTFGGLLLLSAPLFASEGPESYRLEIAASLWRMNTNGTIHADGSLVDLVSDLGVGQRKRLFDGQLTLRFGRKNRFVLEGRPISIRGLNTINRNVTYFGENYSVSETLKSSADVNYVYGGFHHDWFKGSMGRFGSSIGAAYLGLAGSIQGLESGLNKHNSVPFGLPLAGVDFRLFPIPGKRWIDLEGGVRGLPAGGYGHWVEGSAGVGGWLGPVGVQLGYREMLINFHQTGLNANGLNLRFRGPMVSALWSW